MTKYLQYHFRATRGTIKENWQVSSRVHVWWCDVSVCAFMRACVRVFPHILHTYTNLYTRAHSRRNGRSPCVHVSRCFAMHFVFLCPYVPLSIHAYKHIQRIHTCAPSVSMCVWLHACMHVRHAMHLFFFQTKWISCLKDSNCILFGTSIKYLERVEGRGVCACAYSCVAYMCERKRQR